MRNRGNAFRIEWKLSIQQFIQICIKILLKESTYYTNIYTAITAIVS